MLLASSVASPSILIVPVSRPSTRLSRRLHPLPNNHGDLTVKSRTRRGRRYDHNEFLIVSTPVIVPPVPTVKRMGSLLTEHTPPCDCAGLLTEHMN